MAQVGVHGYVVLQRRFTALLNAGACDLESLQDGEVGSLEFGWILPSKLELFL